MFNLNNNNNNILGKPSLINFLKRTINYSLLTSNLHQHHNFILYLSLRASWGVKEYRQGENIMERCNVTESSLESKKRQRSIKTSLFYLKLQRENTTILYERFWELLDQRQGRRGQELTVCLFITIEPPILQILLLFNDSCTWLWVYTVVLTETVGQGGQQTMLMLMAMAIMITRSTM